MQIKDLISQMEANGDFTVTLLSNGSEQYFTNNTLTSFSNQLPQQISFSKDKDWCVSLQDVGIHLNNESFPMTKDRPIIFMFDASDFLSFDGTSIDHLNNI